MIETQDELQKDLAYLMGETHYEVWGEGAWEYIDMSKQLNPADRGYMREALHSGSGIRFLEILIAMRPKLGGPSVEAAAAASHKAEGYELAISNMTQLLEEPVIPPEVKKIDIRSD